MFMERAIIIRLAFNKKVTGTFSVSSDLIFFHCIYWSRISNSILKITLKFFINISFKYVVVIYFNKKPTIKTWFVFYFIFIYIYYGAIINFCRIATIRIIRYKIYVTLKSLLYLYTVSCLTPCYR